VEALSLVSLESAERPNYFLYIHDNETVGLEQWQASASFQRRATFFHHQGLWSPGLSAFELHSKKGFFITLNLSGVKVAKYDDSEEFKHLSSFSIEGKFCVIPRDEYGIFCLPSEHSSFISNSNKYFCPIFNSILYLLLFSDFCRYDDHFIFELYFHCFSK